ncbi:MAG: flavin-containing monooxygenase [Sporichthyaceae bacterium]
MSELASQGLRVVIVGAGFGGIATAIELRRHGITDITILDAADGFGGTWLLNSYPGAACDVPSPFYSYSFAKRNDWTHLCAGQSDILRYVRQVASDHDLDRLARFGTRVDACVWDDASAQWTITAADGRSWEADAIVISTGQLNQPKIPNILGADTFAGRSFHSARWDHDHDLTGRRVAVIGNGPSAVQFVPEIAGQAGHLTVFQRSANWFIPRRNTPYPAFIRDKVQRVPGVQDIRRGFWFEYCELLTVSIRHPVLGKAMEMRSKAFMRWQVRHKPAIYRDVLPDYPFGCKRVVPSSHFLAALTRPNVDLVTSDITEITPTGVRTGDGVIHEADTLIWGTGFASNDFMFPMEITGRNGVSLRQEWAGGAHAHLGMTVPGFPSMFVLYGPNTNTSGGSIIWYLEQQARYVRQALAVVRDRGMAAIEVRREVEAASDRALQAKFAGTAWTGGCESWYLDPNGRNVANWPGYMRQYRKAVRRINPRHFRLIPRPVPTAGRGAGATRINVAAVEPIRGRGSASA